MNYKFYALLLTLALSATPAMQAMRATRSLVATARTLRPAAIPTGKHALAQTHSTRNNGYGYYQEKARHTYDNYSIPAATAIAVGVGLSAQDAMEEEGNNSKVLAKLDIYNVAAVLEVFKSGTEDDKQLVAAKIAQKITYYTTDAVISLLLNTVKRPHRILIQALAKNITHYSPESIIEILNADAKKDTHDFIANALKKNYNHFTKHTCFGYEYAAKEYGYNHYLSMLRALNNTYLHIALEPLLNSLQEYVSNQTENPVNIPSIEPPIYIGAHFATKISNCITCYTESQLSTILKLADRETQDIISNAIAQNISLFKIDALSKILSLITEENKKVIAAAIAKDEVFIRSLKAENLYGLLNAIDSQTQNNILRVFIKNYNFKNGEYVADNIRKYIQKIQADAYTQISQEWGLTERDWATIDGNYNKRIQNIIHSPNSTEQFTYTCEVIDEIKELIASVCKERGITQKIVISENIEYRHKYTAFVSTIYTNNEITFNLSLIKLPPIEEINFSALRILLEHELGGHVRHYHMLRQDVISNYIYDNKLNKWFFTREDIYNSSSLVALRKTNEYEADLSSAIDDFHLANDIKTNLENKKENHSSTKLYMSPAHNYRAIMAIIKLKEAEQEWFDSDEAYNLYGPPAYDKMIFDESKVSVEQNRKD